MINPGIYTMADIQNANCHCSNEFSTFNKCPVVCGAKNPLRLDTVFVTANIAPACLGAKSKGLNEIDKVFTIYANVASIDTQFYNLEQ